MEIVCGAEVVADGAAERARAVERTDGTIGPLAEITRLARPKQGQSVGLEEQQDAVGPGVAPSVGQVPRGHGDGGGNQAGFASVVDLLAVEDICQRRGVAHGLVPRDDREASVACRPAHP